MGTPLTAVCNITWVNNQPQYYGTVTIAGIKYVSTKAGQGLQGNSYKVCTSSNGNAYYTLSGAETKASGTCPAGSTLQALPATTGHPTPAEVFNVIGKGSLEKRM